MKKLLLTTGLLLTALSAGQIDTIGNNNYNHNNQKKSAVFGKYLPYLQLPDNTYIQRKRFEINAKNLGDIYKKYFQDIYTRKKVLDNVFDISILKKPSVKILKSISHIYINPVYIQQLILPKQYKITNAITSTPFSLFKYQNNELHLKASNNFQYGNIVIYYTDGKNNYSMNLLVDNYFQKECMLLNKKYFCRNKKRDKFALSYENFALIYQFKDIKPLDPLEAITLYQNFSKRKITNIKNHSFVSFEYKGLTYFIYRDDTNGNIIVNNKKFFVKP